MRLDSSATTGLILWPPHRDLSIENLQVWRLPLWLRILRQLAISKVDPIYLIGPSEIEPEPPPVPSKTAVEWISSAEELHLKLTPGSECIIVEADWVLDDAIIKYLSRHLEPTVMVLSQQFEFAGAARAPWKTLATLDLRSGGDGIGEALLSLAQAGKMKVLSIVDLPGYRSDLRRVLPVFAHPVRTQEDLAKAQELVLDATQKGTNDLPAQYIHPPLENALVHLLVPRGVSAHAVTTLSIFCALSVVYLFYLGYLLPGILLAMLVGVLDGVDGKIARVKLEASRLGDWYDHLFDYLYEAFWYLALGAYLSRQTGLSEYWVAAGFMCGVYYLDRAVLGIWKLFRNYDFHELSNWDRTFRRICGRRNNIIYLLLPFFLLGYPELGFWTALLWWTVTFLVHFLRVSRALVLKIGQDAKSGAPLHR